MPIAHAAEKGLPGGALLDDDLVAELA